MATRIANQLPSEGNPAAFKELAWPQLMTRVRRIQGQAAAIESALDKDADCSSILQQIAAIKGAVSGLTLQVLEGHIREHLGSAEASEAQRQNDLDEVLGVLRSYLK